MAWLAAGEPGVYLDTTGSSGEKSVQLVTKSENAPSRNAEAANPLMGTTQAFFLCSEGTVIEGFLTLYHGAVRAQLFYERVWRISIPAGRIAPLSLVLGLNKSLVAVCGIPNLSALATMADIFDFFDAHPRE
jgi:hypothetical protein